MNLKMFVLGEGDDVITWIVAESKGQAIEIFERDTALDIAYEFGNPDDYVREANPKESMIYYHDGSTSEEDTMENLIKKYCGKPDIFACSEF